MNKFLKNFKFFLSVKWIALTLLVAIFLPTFKSLSDWQYGRLKARQEHNQQVIAAQNNPVVAVEQLATSLDAITVNDEWRTVSARGNFLTEQTYLLRKRSLNSEAGLWVVTPFKLVDGTLITVVRGWTPAGTSAKATPELTELPKTEVELTARMRLMSATPDPEPNDLPDRQRMWLDPKYGVTYLELISSNPELNTSEITVLPKPELSEGNHHSYAIQWLLFAGMLLIGYLILLRNDFLINRRKLTGV